MTCDEIRNLLDGYFDGELDLQTSLAIEHHLSGCAPCAAELEDRATLRRGIAHPSLYFRAPATLRKKVRPSASRTLQLRFWAGALAVAVAIFAFLSLGSDSRLQNAALSAHLRSLTPDHLIDVPSSDNHTVKPWFNGKVDFSPPVADLKANGFNLTGGRLDYLGERQVAALVYKRREHVINLFEWPENSSNAGVSKRTMRGYRALTWIHSGFHFLAISDLNAKELDQFADLLRSI